MSTSQTCIAGGVLLVVLATLYAALVAVPRASHRWRRATGPDVGLDVLDPAGTDWSGAIRHDRPADPLTPLELLDSRDLLESAFTKETT